MEDLKIKGKNMESYKKHFKTKYFFSFSKVIVLTTLHILITLFMREKSFLQIYMSYIFIARDVSSIQFEK